MYKVVSPPRRVKDFVGKKVRLKFKAQNSLVALPPGTVLTVSHAGPVKTLVSEPCPCCGVAVVVTYHLSRNAFLREVDFVED